MRGLVVSAVILSAAAAQAQDIWNVCTFKTLPDVVFHYPEDGSGRSVRIGGRPPVSFDEGQGSGRVASAETDGYVFQFTPSDSVMRVSTDGKTIGSEVGRCASVNRPIEDVPLDLGRPEQDAPRVAEEGVGEWQVSEETSSFDDSRSVYLRLNSSDTVTTRFGGGQTTPSLHLRCPEKTTSLFIVAGGQFLSDIQGYGEVDYRIDDQAAGRWSMDSSTDNQALGLWNGSTAIPQIKRLFGGDRLVVRLTPFNESPLEFAFPISGVETAVAPLRNACQW